MGAARWWTEAVGNNVKLTLALAALVVLSWEAWRRRDPGPPRAEETTRVARRTRTVNRVLAVLGALSLLAYINVGRFHPGAGFVHTWDAFHHYIGAKYFEELGYDGLYDCKAVADAQEPGAAAVVATRSMTDLRTNQIVSCREIVAHPEGCLDRFSPPRWQAFKSDLSFFRARFAPRSWASLALDHGFNASPAWMLIAAPLAGKQPVTATRLWLLASIDCALLLLALGAVGWAFGLRACALVAILLGVYFPASFLWTGGSFLRWDWLAALLAGLALCRRDKPAWGGALLGYAALSRVFPGFALVGAGLAVLGRLAVGQRPDRAFLRLAMGAVLVAVVLVPLAELSHARPAWSAFGRNLAKHSSVPSANRMGLSTLLAFERDTSLEQAAAKQGQGPQMSWEQEHASTLRRRRAARVAIAVAALIAVAFAARGQPPFVACALGLLLLPFGPALACYYYAFVAALAVLVASRPQSATILLALVAAAAVVSQMQRYAIDDQYAAQSLLVVVGLSFVLSLFIGPVAAAAATDVREAQFDD